MRCQAAFSKASIAELSPGQAERIRERTQTSAASAAGLDLRISHSRKEV